MKVFKALPVDFDVAEGGFGADAGRAGPRVYKGYFSEDIARPKPGQFDFAF